MKGGSAPTVSLITVPGQSSIGIPVCKRPVPVARSVAGLFVLLLAIAPLAAGADPHVPIAGADPLLRPDDAALRDWVLDHERAVPAPAAVVPPVRTRTTTAPLSYSLLPFVPYAPAERDQGAAGTCWVFAGTGCLEVAHVFSAGVLDRLSVHWFDSNYRGGSGPDWAGNGGTLTDFAAFYDERRMAVPWSNANASYVDGDPRSVVEERALMPAELIAETPRYTLTGVQVQRVETRGVGQDQAIANIRAALDRGRPVFAGLLLPNRSAVADFLAFWYGGGERAVWDPSVYDGTPWDPASGAAHAVLCVGPTSPIRPNRAGSCSIDGDGERSAARRHLPDGDGPGLRRGSPVTTRSPRCSGRCSRRRSRSPPPHRPPRRRPVPGPVIGADRSDGDGLYEDVNGNGRTDFADVVLLFSEPTGGRCTSRSPPSTSTGTGGPTSRTWSGSSNGSEPPVQRHGPLPGSGLYGRR